MSEPKTLDIVKTVFQRRLQQSDMDRILAELSATDRQELVSKMGTLLDRISALVEVYNKVSDTLSLDVMLPRLMAIITEALRSDRSTLFLNDPDTNELFSRVAQGDKVGEIRFPNHLGIAGSVFTQGLLAGMVGLAVSASVLILLENREFRDLYESLRKMTVSKALKPSDTALNDQPNP